MSVIDPADWNDGMTRYVFFCPGCNCGHWFKTDGPGPCWTFNGDMEKPTVRASILVSRPARAVNNAGSIVLCHSFITDGQIQYLGDCEHALAGQTVPLPDWNTL